MSWARSTRKDRLRRAGVNGWQEQAVARRVLARDGGICHVCGKAGADQADHVIPLHRGGAHHPANMRAIHALPCHRDKTRAETIASQPPPRRRAAEPHPGQVA